MAAEAVRVGVDVGGTFTDFSCVVSHGRLFAFKLPSTPEDPSQAVLHGVDMLVREYGVTPAAINVFAHGTTVATNAVLERKGARLGLLTTAGFRDVLEIGRQMRRQMYSVRLDPETPVFLAPGRFRKGVRERIGPDGAVIEPLDEADAVAQVAALVEDGIGALAVCLLFSFANPAHERRIAALVAERWPTLPVSLSSMVDPAFREYERTVVTAFDAYIKPAVDAYLARLADGLIQVGVTAPLQIMQSRGGLAGAVTARQRPVRLFLSGPAGGVIGAQNEGRAVGFDDLITVDIGGTSCDIALVSGAKPLIRQEGQIDGYTLRVPMVDVNAIGAGGGSIAWIDAAGGLRVGPHSAGSVPGPACYGRGGGEATVTDASVVLGLIDPGYFVGGKVALDPGRAQAAIRDRVAAPLSMSVEAAAFGIHRVLNAQMAEGIRLVSIKQGFDPRDFALLGLGGAGPLHVCALAEELGMTRCLVPRHPGVLSASGLLAAPVEHEVAAAFSRPLDGLELSAVREALTALDAEAAALMAVEQVDPAAVVIGYAADACYVGQGYTIEVPLDLTQPDPLARLYQDFLALHDRIYGHAVDGPIRLVNLRAVHRAGGGGATGKAEIATGSPVKGTRSVLVAGDGTRVMATVYDRARMPTGLRFEGPAIVEQSDTTTWVAPGWTARTLDTGALLLERPVLMEVTP
ncbi:MAG: hydantoinase/oxoprolinase family protein [Alphaproteobacteria bacterium]|nr:hydantoinase/oxoprolinase family protein [Alphaproteobacteria bacterium]